MNVTLSQPFLHPLQRDQEVVPSTGDPPDDQFWDKVLADFDPGVIEGVEIPFDRAYDSEFATVAAFWDDLGFTVIPGDRKTKAPLVKFDWLSGENAQEVPPEMYEIWVESYRHAIPLLLVDSGRKGFRFTVVDADALDMVPWIEMQFGKTPFFVTTGRDGGGGHLYYVTPDDRHVAGRNKMIGPDEGVITWAYEIDPKTGEVTKAAGWGMTNIDVKSRRNYVVAPGATHASGRKYVPAVDLSTVTVEWCKANVPEFNVDLYEEHVERAKARREEKRAEIAAEVQKRIAAGDQASKTSGANSGNPVVSSPAPAASCGVEPFIKWCRENPSEVNLELWWGLATNLAAAFGKKARDTFHRISALDKGRYDPKVCEYNWQRALTKIEGKAIGPTTYEKLKSNGYDGAVPAGFKAPASFLRARQQPAFLCHREGKFKGLPLQDRIENTRALLAFTGTSVRFNEMAKTTEYTFHDGQRRTSNDAEAEIREAGRKHGFRPTRDVFDEHVRIVRREAAFHPAMDWILSKVWDGVDRLPLLLASLHLRVGADAGLVEILLRRWMLSAAAAAVTRDGVKAEGVLVLVGPQGKGKTRWIASLAPVGIEIGMSLDPANKDSVLASIRNWIVELGELDATFRKADLARLKAFLSQTMDVIRLPYGHREDEFPRRTVFAASVNDSAFLRDLTGNRRYWTVPVESCDPEHGVDMQQLWAQMVVLHENGERHWLDAAESAMLNGVNATHTEPDPMEDALGTFFEPDANNWITQNDIRDAVKDEFTGWGQRDGRAMVAVLRRWADAVGRQPRKSNGQRLWPVRRTSSNSAVASNMDRINDILDGMDRPPQGT